MVEIEFIHEILCSDLEVSALAIGDSAIVHLWKHNFSLFS
jgi:hypothetical protein